MFKTHKNILIITAVTAVVFLAGIWWWVGGVRDDFVDEMVQGEFNNEKKLGIDVEEDMEEAGFENEEMAIGEDVKQRVENEDFGYSGFRDDIEAINPGWQVYRSDKLGYSLEVPGDWVIDDNVREIEEGRRYFTSLRQEGSEKYWEFWYDGDEKNVKDVCVVQGIYLGIEVERHVKTRTYNGIVIAEKEFSKETWDEEENTKIIEVNGEKGLLVVKEAEFLRSNLERKDLKQNVIKLFVLLEGGDFSINFVYEDEKADYYKELVYKIIDTIKLH